ncbi:TonB family protein [Luteolibacter sp. SL250]|uniref:energy transducer TonB n=1 Tax=Luteolibacter sp. SL250 TaxID=2995170 RepID=UPI00227025FC|nr:energy transducer TonB [Luteolibacter sp. SL250]WAC17967.1 TonB family protein [Luteolibacter sp. SL250]
MNPLLYAASIGTFAAWLGVTGASTVGIMVPGKPQVLPELKTVEMPDIVMTDGEFMEVDMMSGGSANTSEVAEENNIEENFAQEAFTPEVQEVVPDVPEVPEIAEVEPLPEVPELPEPEKPQPKPSENTFAIEKKKEPVARKPMVRKTETSRPGSNRPVARRTESGTGSGSGNANNSGSGAGEHGSGRISGGRTPRPTYPAAARKQGIEGTVKVSITFGDSGEVLSCSIVSASHPSLHDQSILSTIRRWKVPGRRGTCTLPVRFTLR